MKLVLKKYFPVTLMIKTVNNKNYKLIKLIIQLDNKF